MRPDQSLKRPFTTDLSRIEISPYQKEQASVKFLTKLQRGITIYQEKNLLIKESFKLIFLITTRLSLL